MIGNGRRRASSEWWLDSGATCHATNDKDLLTEVTTVTDTVENCNGGETDVSLAGTAELMLSSAGEEKDSCQDLESLYKDGKLSAARFEYCSGNPVGQSSEKPIGSGGVISSLPLLHNPPINRPSGRLPPTIYGSPKPRCLKCKVLPPAISCSC